MERHMRVGVVGCGNISEIYFKNLTSRWPWVSVTACTDLVEARAREKADAYGVRVCRSAQELMSDASVDIVLNLTTPPHHASVNVQALEAGKHVYTEKPFALSREDARRVLTAAHKRDLRVGCAPDTFLGAGGNGCRALIDDGAIGEVVSAHAFMVCHGHESWHPDPEFYYSRGGGPMLDMGPYYLTALVNLIGPIRHVGGMTGRAFTERVIGSEKKRGQRISVEVPTHYAGTIEFEQGAIGTVVMSFDTWRSTLPRIEVHGTRGSLLVPDPNGFGGPVRVYTEGDADWNDVPVQNAYAENARGIGVADMALGILESRPHRASGQVAAHVLDAMIAFEDAGSTGSAQTLTMPCRRPEALPNNLNEGQEW